MLKKKNILIVVSIIIILSIVSVVYIVFKIKKETSHPENNTFKNNTLTPEEIQKALSKKAESTSTPLTQEQINQALETKVPQKEKPVSLTPEEIQKALEAK